MRLRSLLRDESGQDMVEYALLLAFVSVISAALLFQNSEAIAHIWQWNADNLSKAADPLR